ncbi:MAG: tetratricopeptide repeat protein, partial [Pseudomonadota bacterium]
AVEYPYPEARGCSGYVPSPLVRLFQRDKDIYFKGKVHEAAEYTILEKEGVIVETDVSIHHYGKLREGRLAKRQQLYSAIGEQKLAESPEDVQAHWELGIQYMEMNRFEEAEKVLKKAVPLDPNNPKVHFNLGVSLEAQGKIAEAIDAYREVLRCDVTHIGAYNNLASLLKSEGKNYEIKTLYEEAIKHNPRHYIVRYNFGTFLKELGEISAAIEQFKSALAIDPDFVDAHYNLGVIHLEQGLYEEAIKHYQEVIRKKTDHASAHNNLGIAHEGLGRFDEAIEEYQVAIGHDTSHITAHNNLGRICMNLGKYQDAAKEFGKVLEIDSNHPTARKDLEIACQKLEVLSRIEEATRQVGDLKKLVNRRELVTHCNLLDMFNKVKAANFIESLYDPENIDPVGDAILEVSAYTREPMEEVREKLRVEEPVRKDWERSRPNVSIEADLIRFYSETDSLIYDGMASHARDGQLALHNRLIEICKELGVSKILDYGAGVGTLCLFLKEERFNVIHADIKGKTFDFAKWRYSIRKKDIPMIPLPNDDVERIEVDCIICLEVIEHVLDPTKVLEMFYRMLPSDGVLIMSESCGAIIHCATHLKSNKRYAGEKFFELMEKVGFERLKQYDSLYPKVYRKTAETNGCFVDKKDTPAQFEANGKIEAKDFEKFWGNSHEDIKKVLELIKPDDLVLDIGGGHKPFARANFVVDLLSYKERGRGGVIGEMKEHFNESTWMTMDLCGNSLPFKDKEIDFIFCAQTVEDLRDPLWVCKEMNRVGKKGYIEFPSKWIECQYNVDAGPYASQYVGYCNHKWLIEIRGNKLLFTLKTPVARIIRSVPEHIVSKYIRDPRIWTDGFFWDDSFEYEELKIDSILSLIKDIEDYFHNFDYLKYDSDKNQGIIGREIKEKYVEPTLSLCMIVKNEEEYLPKCLRAIKSIVDEMVIVDTGSTDRTIEIAETFGARVFKHPWNDDFAEARNVSLKHARCDWILVLDADEVIAEGDFPKIKDLIETKDVDGYRLIQRNYDHDSSFLGWCRNEDDYEEGRGFLGYGISALVRLFRRKPEILFRGKIHEGVEPSLMEHGLKIEDTEIPIHHYGKVRDRSYVKRKAENYRKLGEEQVRSNPQDAKAVSDLGTQYIETDDLDKAEEALRKAIELDPSRMRTYFDLGVVCAKKERWQDALKAFVKAIELDPRDASSRYNCGFALEQLGETQGAFEQYQEAISHNLNHVEAHFRLALIYGDQGRLEDSIQHYEKAIDVLPGHVSAYNNLGAVYERMGRSQDAIQMYRKTLELNPDHENAGYNLNELLKRAEGTKISVEKDKIRVVFFNKGMRFNGNTLDEKPLGGMETAVINMARELAQGNYRVEVFCDCDRPGTYDGVEYLPVESFEKVDEIHLLISVRYLDPFYTDIPANVKILWTGDAYDQPYLNPLTDSQLWERIDRIFAVSSWQAETFQGHFRIPKERFFITRNGINKDYFQSNPQTTRNYNRIVYTSTPFRGLDVLLEVFPKIQAAVPEVELHVFSSMAVYQVSQEEDKRLFADLYRKAHQPGVFLRG